MADAAKPKPKADGKGKDDSGKEKERVALDEGDIELLSKYVRF